MTDDLDFDDERLARAFSIPVMDRRLAKMDEAAATTGDHDFTVHHSSHDDLKNKVLTASMSRMVLSRDEFPDARDAQAVAYLIGKARGTYPTLVEVTGQ